MERTPGVVLPYIVQSREQAKEIIWPPLEQLSRELGLGLKFMGNTGNIHHPNGSRILLFGGGTRREIDKLRGIKFPEVAVDEAQLFPGKVLRYLLDEVLTWCMADYAHQDPAALITGTPNAACAGAFFQMWKGVDEQGKALQESFSRHHWTMAENPHMAAGRDPAWLAALMRKRGWTPQSSAFLREFKGLWVRDLTALVYKLDTAEAPRGNIVKGSFEAEIQHLADDWEFTLGIDFGVASQSAFSVVAHSQTLQQSYVVCCYKIGNRSGVEGIPDDAQPASRFVKELELIFRRYDIGRKMGDFGGQGKAITETLHHDYGIMTEAAQKTQKAAHIEFFNSDLQAHSLFVCEPECRDLIEEMEILQWDQSSYETGTFKEQRGSANHACDATLYAWRAGSSKSFDDWEPAPPKPGTAEWGWLQDEEAAQRYLRALDAKKPSYGFDGLDDDRIADPEFFLE